MGMARGRGEANMGGKVDPRREAAAGAPKHGHGHIDCCQGWCAQRPVGMPGCLRMQAANCGAHASTPTHTAAPC